MEVLVVDSLLIEIKKREFSEYLKVSRQNQVRSTLFMYFISLITDCNFPNKCWDIWSR